MQKKSSPLGRKHLSCVTIAAPIDERPLFDATRPGVRLLFRVIAEIQYELDKEGYQEQRQQERESEAS